MKIQGLSARIKTIRKIMLQKKLLYGKMLISFSLKGIRAKSALVRDFHGF